MKHLLLISFAAICSCSNPNEQEGKHQEEKYQEIIKQIGYTNGGKGEYLKHSQKQIDSTLLIYKNFHNVEVYIDGKCYLIK